ncbi:hypothetical protein [Streptomyces sp. NPDC058092]|uniref:hypothetical protein n=1 Tax=Streptomyces sp. NPDC058092 TaxID=3346336 RepID=UPI0036EEA3BC
MDIVGERTPVPAALAEDEDDVITIAEQEIDLTCRLMQRYGWNAAMYCNVCRAVLNGL